VSAEGVASAAGGGAARAASAGAGGGAASAAEAPQLGYARAINQALGEEMRRDERVWMLGQDVGRMGGVFGVTRGLFDEFGAGRVRDTTLNETFIVGAAAGAAITGTIPVAELQFADFMLIAGDEVFHKMAKWRYMHGGQLAVPMVLRLPTGVLGGVGAEHSQSLEALGMHFPGLKVALPATPADAKGLLKTAIRDPNPVLFFEHKGMYRVKGPVPADPDFTVPFGVAAVRRRGEHLTVVATGLMVGRALEAAEALAAEGIELEVIDPRTLVPLDMETIVGSVERTGRALVVQEAVRTAGAGAEIAARIQEAAFFALDAPVWRLGALDTSIPQSPALEQLVIPSSAQIAAAARELVAI
jgi:pyruvate dehydrogenase E1 component beta subunit